MRHTRTTPLWKYLIIAVLLHLAVVLIPGRIYEVFFPTSAPRDAGPPRDLMPEFEEFAIHVVYIGDEEPKVEIRATPPAEVAAPEAAPDHADRRAETGPPRRGRTPQEPEPPAGEGAGEGTPPAAEPRFYPPVPRLIVPPSVENLDLEDVTVTLGILVDKEGRPLEVVITNPPRDRAVYDRIMEAAKRFRFRPARRGAEPVEAWIELPLSLETTRRR